MPYFVIGPDGAKYGPADVALLKNWLLEGRVKPDSILEDTATNSRTTTARVLDIGGGSSEPAPLAPPVEPSTIKPPVFGAPTPKPQPMPVQPMPGYARMGTQPVHVETHLAKAIVALFLCCFIGVIAVVFSTKASTAAAEGDERTANYYANKADEFANWGITVFCVGIAVFLIKLALGLITIPSH